MKKMPIVLALIVMMNSLNLPAMAVEGEGGEVMLSEGASEVEANRIEDSKLVFSEIDPKHLVVRYKFDGAAEDLMLSRVVLATYKDGEYSQAMVEAELGKLDDQVEPDWAKEVKSYVPYVSEHYEWKRDLSIGSKGFLDNAPGVLYYAAYIQDKSWNDGYWVRGKLDYRECTYMADNEPHNMRICGVKVDLEAQEYTFEPAYGETPKEESDYVSWDEELGDKLGAELDEMGSRVEAWHGDDAEKEALEVELGRIRKLADDAINKSEILGRVEEYERLLEEKAAVIAAEQLMGEVEVGVENWGGDEDDKTTLLDDLVRLEEMLEELGGEEKESLSKRVEICRENLLVKMKELGTDKEDGGGEDDKGSDDDGAEDDGNAGGLEGGSSDSEVEVGDSVGEGFRRPSGGTAMEDASLEVDGANSDDYEDGGTMVEIDDSGKLTSGEENNQISAISENTDIVGEKNEVGRGQQVAPEMEVPVLNEGNIQEERGKNNLWWLIGAMILALGTGLWWVKRAFWSKKPKAR